MIAFFVSPGDIQDRDAAAPLSKVARKRFPSLARAIAGGGYQGGTTAAGILAQAGIPLEIVKRSDKVKGDLCADRVLSLFLDPFPILVEWLARKGSAALADHVCTRLNGKRYAGSGRRGEDAEHAFQIVSDGSEADLDGGFG